MKVCEKVCGAYWTPESHVSGLCWLVVEWYPVIHCQSTVSPAFTVTADGEKTRAPFGPTWTVFVDAAAIWTRSSAPAPQARLTVPDRTENVHAIGNLLVAACETRALPLPRARAGPAGIVASIRRPGLPGGANGPRRRHRVA